MFQQKKNNKNKKWKTIKFVLCTLKIEKLRKTLLLPHSFECFEVNKMMTIKFNVTDVAVRNSFLRYFTLTSDRRNTWRPIFIALLLKSFYLLKATTKFHRSMKSLEKSLSRKFTRVWLLCYAIKNSFLRIMMIVKV